MTFNYESTATVRKVIDIFRVSSAQILIIDDINIGDIPFLQYASIFKAQYVR